MCRKLVFLFLISFGSKMSEARMTSQILPNACLKLQVLLELHTPTDIYDISTCDQINVRGVLAKEAIVLTLHEIRNREDGLEIGADIVDVCGNVVEALRNSGTPVRAMTIQWEDEYFGAIGPMTRRQLSFLKMLRGRRHPRIVLDTPVKDADSFFRVQAPYSDIAKATVNLFKRFNWDFISVFDPSGHDMYDDVMSSVFEDNDICVETRVTGNGQTGADWVTRILEEKVSGNGVVFTSADAETLRLTLETAQRKNLTDRLVWVTTARPSGDGHSDILKNVLIVEPEVTSSVGMSDFTSEVLRRVREKYNLDFAEEMKPNNDEILVAARQAVMTFYHALLQYKSLYGSENRPLCNDYSSREVFSKLRQRLPKILKNIRYTDNGQNFSFTEQKTPNRKINFLAWRDGGWRSFGGYDLTTQQTNIDSWAAGHFSHELVCRKPCAEGEMAVRTTGGCCHVCVQI